MRDGARPTDPSRPHVARRRWKSQMRAGCTRRSRGAAAPRKKLGFSDRADSRRADGLRRRDVARSAKPLGVIPTYRLVDTCAAEFEAYTPYYYSTYGDENERRESGKQKVIILGGGPNRIGQGIEFDYCCVHAAFALREELGFETIMVNSNPETVSTDYDTSDKLYFEPLTLEDVLNICEQESENLFGVIVQFGGQTPLNLADGLAGSRRPDHRHLAAEHRDRRGPQALRRDARQARHPPDRRRHRDRPKRRRSPSRDRIGYPGPRAPVLRARRPRHADRPQRRRDLRALHRGTSRVRGRVAATRRSAMPRRSLPRRRRRGGRRLHQRRRDRGHRRDHGAHRGGRHSQRRQRLRHSAVLA